MDDVKGFVKQYWPYIVGGIVGLYLILKFAGGGSSSASGDGGYGAFLQAQTAAGAQNAALQMQMQAAADKNALDSKALDAQIAINNATLQVQKEKNYADAFNAFQNSQAAMAQSIGSSTANVIDALNAPSIAAMQAGAVENAAALEAAGNVAAASYLTQGQIVATSSTTAGQMAQAISLATSSIGSLGQKKPTDWGGIAGAAAQAYGAYATGGASLAMGGYGSNYYKGSTLGGSAFTAPQTAGSAWGGM